MLKLVCQNDKNNEKSIQEELGVNNLIDFFSSSDPKSISEKINSTLSEIKYKSKKEDAFYTKLIYYFSILINSKSFKNDDKAKTSIKNLIQVCEPEFGVKIYQDLFNLFDEDQKDFKKHILNEINNSKFNFSEDEMLSLFNLFVVFVVNEKKINKNYESEIVDKLAELVANKKLYHLLRKIDLIEKFRINIRDQILKNKDKEINNINTSKLIFFITLSSPDFVDEDLSIYKLNAQLKVEKGLCDALDNRQDAEILFDNSNKKYFDDIYGEKGTELILTGAKETCIHEILVGFEDDKQTKVSFKEFITSIYEEDDEEEDKKKKVELKDDEIQSKFEEIEDMIISGKEHKLYNVVVDYFKKEIKILYIRKPTYEDEQKKLLLDKVKIMKSKLEVILKAIDKI